jgi:hypothetical protein
VGDLTAALVRFWTEGPPMTGALRIYLYASLLALWRLAHLHSAPDGDAPLCAPEVLARSHPRFFEPPGLAAWLGSAPPGPARLRRVRAVVVAAWVCCVLGLGGHAPPVVVALGGLYLHGVLAGALGTNHRWMVPAYVLLALCFAEMNHELSADLYLSRRFAGYPFAPGGPPIFHTGFARKLALVFATFTLLAGATSKLLNAGPRWMDGATIQFHVARDGVGTWPRVKRFFARRRWACAGLAVGTMVLEVGAAAGLFWPEARPWIFLAAAGLHLGIWFTLNPNYLPQTVCYALLVDWALLAGRAPAPVPLVTDAAGALLCWGATLASLALGAVALARVEWWPLTHIPMYSFYRGPEGQWTHAHFRDLAQARQAGRELAASRLPYPLAWSEHWVFVRFRAGGGRALEVRPRDVLPKHWRRLLHRSAALDLAAPGPPEGRAARAFLERHLAWLRAHVAGSPDAGCRASVAQSDPAGRFELVCRLATGDLVLAAVPAGAAEGKETSERLDA